MTGIVDERLELPLGFGSSGGPEWRTETITLASGHEVRNGLWALPRKRWDITGIVQKQAELQALAAFFNARSGARDGFRFRDPDHWTSAQTGQTVSPLDQSIGIGDGSQSVFQLSCSMGGDVTRPITRPVAGRVRVALDGNETTGFSVDHTTGLVTFAAPPADGTLISAGFEFDTPVRFESDALIVEQTGINAQRVVRLSLLEVRERVQ